MIQMRQQVISKRKKLDDTREVFKFGKSQLVRHSRPLDIKVYIGGRPISRVLIDGGAIMNVMPLKILRKFCKRCPTTANPPFNRDKIGGKPILARVS